MMASQTYQAYKIIFLITAVLLPADGMRVRNSLSSLGETMDKFPGMPGMGPFGGENSFPNMHGNTGINPMNPSMKPSKGMGFPDIDMGRLPFDPMNPSVKPTGGTGLPDMDGLIPGGGQMAEMAACEKRQVELCCGDISFMAGTCNPLQFCMIATGQATYPGPLICDPEFLQAMYMFGGQGKCSKDDRALGEELTQALPMCMQQLQPLYDLQKSLVECTTEVKAEISEIEKGSQAIAGISKEAEDCQAKVEETKQEHQTESIKAGFAFCVAQQDELMAAMMKWQEEVHVCIAAKIPKIQIEVEIPTIDIPVINASIDVPNINVPDFTTPSFDSNIAIPGGGDKLNMAFDWKQSHEPPKLITLDERIAKVKADVAKCEETKTTIPAKKEKMQQATAQATEQKTKMCAEVGSMLQLDVADQLSTADPSEAAKVQISILETFKKTNPFMSCDSAIAALNTFITVLQLC